MKASLRSVRIAPKKANLVAGLVRGKPVLEAISTLERTNKKAARLLEELLKSAVANAKHNEKQDANMLVVKTLTVNKAQAYHRGVPMARGRVRPMRKYLSHINLTLGIKDVVVDEPKAEKETKKPAAKKPAASKKTADSTSKTTKSSVKTTAKSAKGTSTSAKKKDTAASDSVSANA